MTASTMGKLLELTTRQLHELHTRYAALAQSCSKEATRTLAGFLARRELDTVAGIERYVQRDEHKAALDVHVRLGGGFPFEVEQQWPAEPDRDRMIEIAQDTDKQLEQLCERVGLYAVGEQITETLDAIREMVGERRQRLSAAARELEENEHAVTAGDRVSE